MFDTSNNRPFRLKGGQQAQSILILAGLMVGLIGMLGLAIDGGGVFVLQRQAQNAADAALLATTNQLCLNDATFTSADIEAMGRESARLNGFENVEDPNETGDPGIGDGYDRRVVVENPPTEGNDEVVGDENAVRILVYAEKPSFFMQVLGRGHANVQASAIGRCRPGANPDTIGALNAFGLCGGNSDELRVSGGGQEADINGGIFSSGSVFLQAGSNSRPGTYETPIRYGGILSDGSPSGETLDYSTAVFDGTSPLPDGTNDIEAVVQGSYSDPYQGYFEPEEFAPGGTFAEAAANDPEGGYYQMTPTEFEDLVTSNTADIPTGLYYVDGDIRVNGGARLVGVATLVATGDVDIRGETNLSAYIQNLVFYGDGGDLTCQGNSKAVSFSGSGIQWLGLFYAPNGNVSLSMARGEARINGSIIAHSLDIQGATVVINFDPDLLPPFPPAVEIIE